MRIKDQPNHNDFIMFQIRRNILNMAKECLIILEDLKKENVLSEEYYHKMRGKILSGANDKIRDLQEIIKDLDIEIKKT